MGKRRGGYQEVIRPNGLAGNSQLCPDDSLDFFAPLIKGERWELLKESLQNFQILFPSGAPVSAKV
jgi:hypothetical protein